MLDDIIGAASNLFNTPGVVMMGVGVFSAMVLRSLVAEANRSSSTFICYQSGSDEFPLPIPVSIYKDKSENEKFCPSQRILPRCFGEQSFFKSARKNSPEERCTKTPVQTNPTGTPIENVKYGRIAEKPTAAPYVVPLFLDNEDSKESLADAGEPMQETKFPNNYSQEHQKETASSLPEPTNFEKPLCKVRENSSDPAAGDTYLIVEPPEDSSESENLTPHSKTERLDSITLSSFTGPFLLPMNVDDSTSQSVTWTEAFVEREPFDHELEEKADDKKTQKSKSRNQKC